MLKKLGLGNLFQWVIVIIIGLAIWKGSGENPHVIVQTCIDIVLKGSDIVLQVWEQISKNL